MVQSSIKERMAIDSSGASSSGLTNDLSLSHNGEQLIANRKRNSLKHTSSRVRFAHAARSYLLNEKKLTSRRIYRSLMLKDNVIIRTPQKISWIMEILIRELALMGQEVDIALFDLHRPDTFLKHKFFTPQLAPAYDNLIELIQIVLPSTTECALARHTFLQLLTHWMFVCHMHLIRGWLLCRPKRRGLNQVCYMTLPLGRLLLQRHYFGQISTQSRNTLELLDYVELKCLNDIVELKVARTCKPRLAKNVYGLLFNLLHRRRLFDRQDGLRNSTVLNILVLIEAEWNAAKRLINQFRDYLDNVLEENMESDELQLKGKPKSFHYRYEDPLEFASATAGLISIICLILLLILFKNVLKHTCCANFGAQLEIGHSDLSFTSMHRVFTTYCCLAPFCVYLNLEMRLWLTDLLINKLDIVTWFTTSDQLRTNDTANHIPPAYKILLNRLNFEIHWSWKTVEHFEHRLQSVCRQLYTELAHWDLPVPLEYACEPPICV